MEFTGSDGRLDSMAEKELNAVLASVAPSSQVESVQSS